jgi:anti-anti-sigma factor
LRGELDMATVPSVEHCLDELRGRGETVLLDLDELTFMDASGIRVVLSAAHHAAQDGWDFSVTRGSDRVRKLFEIVQLDGELPFEDRSP